MAAHIRKVALVAATGILVAGVGWAQPDPSTSSFPHHFLATGHNGGVPDPIGTATFIINDPAGLPVPAGVIVQLDFSLCTDVCLSQNVTGPATVTNCAAQLVLGATLPGGILPVNIVAGGNGTGPFRVIADCVRITVGGVPFPNATVATADRDGVLGVGAGALALIIYDFIVNPNAARSDLDSSGMGGAGDLSLLQSIFFVGDSGQSGSPFCPPC